MSVKELGTGDALRIEDTLGATIAEFTLLGDDTVNEDTIEGDVNVIVPTFGNPYILYNNPVGSEYTSGSLSLEGTKAAFDAVKDQCAKAGTFKVVRLKMGGNFMVERQLLQCVITGVSTPRNVVHGDTWVQGELSFIRIP